MSRIHHVALGGLVLVGLATTFLLRSTRPLGQMVASTAGADYVLADRRSPRTSHDRADLKLVVFTDYRCPACRKAHPSMHAAVLRDGRVQVIYKDWPIFGEPSERAARVALASHQQGIYRTVHDHLMRSPAFDDAALRKALERSGGSWRRLEADLVKHGASIDDQLATNRRDAFALGLQGTPGYVIGPLLIQGALTEREFLMAFKQARSAR